MKSNTDILVIGGGPSGIVAAVMGKSSYPEKDVLLIRKEKQAIIPCGIPYIFGSLENSAKDIVADKLLNTANVKLRIGEVISLDQKDKVCKLTDGQEISFEKLVLALGSTPTDPKWLKGTSLKNVFTVQKDKEYIDQMMTRLKGHQKVVVVGGGFIGVEISDEINKIGKDVTIVEVLPHILGLAFDEEISIKAEEQLISRGVKIRVGVGAQEILGDERVTGILLQNGEKLEADAVILSMGYRPNTELAHKSGLEINEMGFIVVDEYMRTGNPDIFAIGDCAEKRDFFTRRLSRIMLASTATSEARIAAMNLYNLSVVKTFGGTIGIFSTAIGDTGLGAAGLTETVAKRDGFDVVTGTFEGVNKHPGALLGTHKQTVKLIVGRKSGIILGGEAIGGTGVGELINLVGFVVQNKMTINSILTAQIGTHPLLTAPPTAYPLIKAAEVVAKKI